MRRGAFLALLGAVAAPQLLASQETMAGYLNEEYSCIMCHTDMREDFLQGVHSERGIVCVDCHGGDPMDFEREGAHRRLQAYGEKGSAVRLCLSCHGDLERMRQFVVLSVTREEYLLSRHGQSLLVAGDQRAPSCSDCHGSHAIFPKEDLRSLVNPTRVASTCAVCHSDPSHMPAGFPTGQFAEWEESSHGEGLLARGNTASATCASCHGSHAALPPGVNEVPNVCGNCHRLVRDAYFDGVHGDGAEGTSGIGCTSCHANHATETPPLREISTLCGSCHDEDSPAALAGLQLQEQVTAAERAYESAREAIHELTLAGQSTRDEDIRLLTLTTDFQSIRVAAHSLDPESLEDLVRRVTSLSVEIRESAEVAAEEHWERKLLLIPLWIGVLGGVILALRKRRLLAMADGAEGPQGPDRPSGGEDGPKSGEGGEGE